MSTVNYESITDTHDLGWHSLWQECGEGKFFYENKKIMSNNLWNTDGYYNLHITFFVRLT